MGILTVGMTSIPRQLATFAAVLLVLYAAGYGAGLLIEDGGDGDAPAGHGAAHNPDRARHGGAPPVDEVRGLSARAGGLRLVAPEAPLARGAEQRVRFTVLGADGAPLTDYDVVHEKRMHLIVVRRDLSAFQHLHPRLDPSGEWIVRARFDEPGDHRLFADFVHEGRPYTLAGDVRVTGSAADRPLPEPAAVARAGGYEVRLDAAQHGRLAFAITRDGTPVDPAPYLGAEGHLVALRERDLAFLHVHPEQDELAFETRFPTAGRYRLFLQFRHAGQVSTAAFTHDATSGP